MSLAVTRKIRDRKFIKYEPEKHFIRAYAMSKDNSNIWDLFPPIKGYRPFNAKTKHSYTISQQRQHTDWAKLVVQRDNRKCMSCGSELKLEAHHIWPQGAYIQLRYTLKNGITLCKDCHLVAYHAPEITPGQFLELTNESEEINAHIEADNFWEYYTAGLAKGRVLAYQLLTPGQMLLSEEEKEWFISWASMNRFVERSEDSANSAPITDGKYKISEEIKLEIQKYGEEKSRSYMKGK